MKELFKDLKRLIKAYDNKRQMTIYYERQDRISDFESVFDYLKIVNWNRDLIRQEGEIFEGVKNEIFSKWKSRFRR